MSTSNGRFGVVFEFGNPHPLVEETRNQKPASNSNPGRGKQNAKTSRKRKAPTSYLMAPSMREMGTGKQKNAKCAFILFLSKSRLPLLRLSTRFGWVWWWWWMENSTGTSPFLDHRGGFCNELIDRQFTNQDAYAAIVDIDSESSWHGRKFD